MIFPDKPRPPWQYAQPPAARPRAGLDHLGIAAETKSRRPPGYWRERIELTIIVVGFYFWVEYWLTLS